MTRPCKLLTSSQKGFSLIETVLAVALLGTVVTALLAGLSVAMKASRCIADQVAAANQATTYVEDYTAGRHAPVARAMVADVDAQPENILLSATSTPIGLTTGIVLTVSDSDGTMFTIITSKVDQGQ